MIHNFFHNLGRVIVHSSDDDSAKHRVTKDFLSAFIAWLIVVVIILFIGKLLWNDVFVKLVPGIKQAKSIWQILGLYILFSLLIGR
jgi:hypothetical protein